MFRKIKLLFSPLNVFIKLIQLRWRGMLYEEGWFEAACDYKSINRAKEPIPWWTYSFNDFFIPQLTSDIEIFEYGSGNSTIFLAKIVQNITSIEHDKAFYNFQIPKIPKNVTLKFQLLDKYNGKYSKVILNESKLFDLIIIDGRDRVNCIKNSISRLSEHGIIILDDSQRHQYQTGIDFLIENNFKYISFTGISAGTYKKKATSIFYRKDNWIGI